MPDERSSKEPRPEPSKHLRPIRSDSRWIRSLGPIGLGLLLAALALTFLVPSSPWLLLYPLLIIGGLAALTSAVAFLMRHF